MVPLSDLVTDCGIKMINFEKEREKEKNWNQGIFPGWTEKKNELSLELL